MTVMQAVARRASQAFLNAVLPQQHAATTRPAIPTLSVDDDSTEGDGGARKRSSLVSASRSYDEENASEQCVDKYKEHFSFLRDAKFLQELENDSVDSEIIEQELSALQQVPISTRQKAVKFLQSNPVQILLCVIVLLDAGIVIAQILLDLNSVKDKLVRRDSQLSDLVSYIRATQPGQLHGYLGKDVELILQLLRSNDSRTNQSTASSSISGQRSGINAHGSVAGRVDSAAESSHSYGDGSVKPTSTNPDNGNARKYNSVDWQSVEHGEYDVLHEVAHGLHFASIAMLGFLVVEIFDAFIIASSFAIDIVFLGGVSGEEGQKAAALLVILLLWRIARVVDGILVTVKQRQEFRIRLQKRARRIAERKLETFEEERNARTRQIEALKDLCAKAGITDADIAACAPLNPSRVNTTLCALSSVARLSVSMTMLMSSGIYRSRHGSAAMDDCAAAACAAAAAAAAGTEIANRPPSTRFYRPGSVVVGGGRSSYRSIGDRSTTSRRSMIVSGAARGGAVRGPARNESLPNMRNGVTGPASGSVERPPSNGSGSSKRGGVVTTGHHHTRKSSDTDGPVSRQRRRRDVAGGRRRDQEDIEDDESTSGGSSSVFIDIDRFSSGGSAQTSADGSSTPESTSAGHTRRYNHSKMAATDGQTHANVAGMTAENDGYVDKLVQSPVNSSGVQIIIDSESDVEQEVKSDDERVNTMTYVTDHSVRNSSSASPRTCKDNGANGRCQEPVSGVDNATTPSECSSNENCADAPACVVTLASDSSSATGIAITSCTSSSVAYLERAVETRIDNADLEERREDMHQHHQQQQQQ